MKKILLAVLALAIASCRPPYDGDLSYTAALAGKMRLEAAVGPVASKNESNSAVGVFLPMKTGTGVDAENGFIAFTNSYGSSLWYTGLNADGGYLTIKNNWQNSSYNSDPRYPVFDFQPLKPGYCIAVNASRSDNPAGNQFFRIGVDLTPGAEKLIEIEWPAVIDFGVAAANKIAAQVFPDVSTTYEQIFYLAQVTPTTYQEIQAQVEATVGRGAATILNATAYNLAFLPYGITRCLYYRYPAAAMSYASFCVGGAWQCWRWYENPLDPANPYQTQLKGITKRIDALLTTGELFSTQDDVGRVYDSDGNLLADFHLGGLKFAFEAYVSGVAHVFFSQMYVIEEQVYFNVYSIKTAKLKDL